MKNTLFGFGVVLLIGAAWFTLGIGPMQPIKNLAVLAFLLPGVVAVVAGIEMTRLRSELRNLRAREKTASAL
jgi:biotin transporter BioY